MNKLLSLDVARQSLREGTGRGVKIAIIDSGIDVTHPALAGLTLADDIAVVDKGHYIDVIPGGGVDLYGHGTAIAHIIHSIAPEAEIGSIRVLGDRLNSRTAIIQEGARQALDLGYHILNCSFGCGIEEHILKYKAWIDEAYLKGVHIVAACNNVDFHKPEWPGYFPSVFTVNFCQTERPDQFFYSPGYMVEFAARGEDVEVPWSGGGYKKVTGTSYATPHIVGMLARLISRIPGIRPLEAKALMQRLADAPPLQGEARQELAS
ncbi:MAG: alkaline serine protease [Verrucomicrobia bacterium Tous-C9LFEB]|nr:MAG: alkaline serine protease [Verrucomicrobia bacterium Tous-C9LFEB]